MLLVLGRPGSGCSTFLKAIANKREEYAEVSGDVSYGGIDAAKQKKTYRGEVVYNVCLLILVYRIAELVTYLTMLATARRRRPFPRIKRLADLHFCASQQDTEEREIRHPSDCNCTHEDVRYQ